MDTIARWALPAAFALAAANVLAQAAPPQAQRGGTSVEPPERVDPLYIPVGPDQPGQEPWREPVLRLQLTADFPLRAGQVVGAGTQGARPGSPTVQALLRWRPLQDPGWFAQAALHKYLDAARQRPWDPDFTYAFGYDDGQPGRWAFLYANYTGTRLNPDGSRGESRFNFLQGQWTASYRFAVPEALESLALVGDGDGALCHADANWVPRYTQSTGLALGRDKVSLALGCRYTRPGGWFAHATAYAWPDRARQQPWDPDFTYGIGWTDPAPGGLTLQYANYSGNRWPGRRAAEGEGSLRSGSISVTWGRDW
ncbi:MAG: hypothetical protein EOO24_36065 [Comamonadaceae bacterium]|nr:MAG: hypothetical protein EOO24_36065 [Comamonadaceae bacterium]